jgi:hypothetical protein
LAQKERSSNGKQSRKRRRTSKVASAGNGSADEGKGNIDILLTTIVDQTRTALGEVRNARATALETTDALNTSTVKIVRSLSTHLETLGSNIQDFFANVTNDLHDLENTMAARQESTAKAIAAHSDIQRKTILMSAVTAANTLRHMDGRHPLSVEGFGVESGGSYNGGDGSVGGHDDGAGSSGGRDGGAGRA